jgi:uncharacterized membrane protein
VRAIRYFLPWVGVLVLFGFGVSLLPKTTWESIAITQVPLLPVTGLLVYGFFSSGGISEKAIKVTTALVSLTGLSFAIYLGVTWVSGVAPTCSTGGCGILQGSKAASLFFGIRTTTVGMIGYSLVLLSLLIPGVMGRLSTTFLGTFGFGTSVYLAWYSVTVWNTTCQWCLGSGAAMTAIFALSYWRLFRSIG